MVRTFQGHFADGQFVVTEGGRIPENVKVYVIATDEEVGSDEARIERQLAAYREFVKANKEIDDEPFDEAYHETMPKRFNITRELDL